MNIYGVIGAGIAAAAVSVVLRQYNKEYGLYIALAFSVVVFSVVLNSFQPIFNFIDTLSEISDVGSKYTGVLIKALLICYMTQLASDCCRDCGENAIASKIDFAGKIAILMISLPLFEAILNIIKELIV